MPKKVLRIIKFILITLERKGPEASSIRTDRIACVARDTDGNMSFRLLFYDQIINLASPRKIAKDGAIRASTVPVRVLREP
ncbi:hypothetical protein CWM53_00425 [Klebsiella sp. A-Nf5]|nr:hypothetical protein CWM61_05200 [Klebsiella sp. K-Nf6]PJX34276.1 hypothetical protein CWM53_00425 [Klebsiella sp. A-Nf5]PJX37405.1 hypothetical protein CWM59_12165 [Klebsiella sp. B-Nf7]PJX48272.1 hypothetical protein CWM60_11595 [Klebsiella sp. C1-16S-Nf17]